MPFSLNDILERIIPGLVFQIFIFFLFFPNTQFSTIPGPTSMMAFAAVVLALPLGTLFNIIASWVAYSDNRYFWHKEKSHKFHDKIDAAIKDTFGIDSDSDDSWRLCYGIVEKNEYGVNVAVLRGLYVFCDSMMICMWMVSALFIGRAILSKEAQLYDPVVFVAALILGFVFLFGSRMFSRAFVFGVYEAFFTWYKAEN